MAISEIWGTAKFKDMLLNSILEGIYTVQARKAEKQKTAEELLNKLMLGREYIPEETAKEFEEKYGISIPKKLMEDISEKAKSEKWWEGKVQQYIKLGEEIPVETQLIAISMGVSPDKVEVGVSSTKTAKEEKTRQEEIKKQKEEKLTPLQKIQEIQLKAIEKGDVPIPGTLKPVAPKTIEIDIKQETANAKTRINQSINKLSPENRTAYNINNIIKSVSKQYKNADVNELQKYGESLIPAKPKEIPKPVEKPQPPSKKEEGFLEGGINLLLKPFIKPKTEKEKSVLPIKPVTITKPTTTTKPKHKFRNSVEAEKEVKRLNLPEGTEIMIGEEKVIVSRD